MKKLLLGSVAIVALAAGSAGAADLAPRTPVKAVPVVAPPVAFSWSGCYIGGHVGGGWGRKTFHTVKQPGGVLATTNTGTANFTALPSSITPTIASNLFNANGHLINTGDFDQTESGVIGGGQVGCNYQFARSWVIGAEGEFSWSGMKSSRTGRFGTARLANAALPEGSGDSSPVEGPFSAIVSTNAVGTLAVKTDFLATITGRIGWVPWDRVMLYGKGGAAFAHDKYRLTTTVTHFIATTDFDCFGELEETCSFTASRSFVFNSSQDRWGWTVGGGIETAIWGNWTARLEYDYLDFGSKTATFTDPSFGSIDVNVTQHIHEVKFGINYLFNWGKGKAPVVARY